MSREITTRMRRAINAPETDEVFILLVTLTHETLADPIRVCSTGVVTLPEAGAWGVVSRGMEFVFLPFEFRLPGEVESQSPYAEISMDNISREIVAAVRSIRSSPSVTVEIVLASEPDVVEAALDGFRLTGIRYDKFAVSGNLSIEVFENEPFPGDCYLPSNVPGIF